MLSSNNQSNQYLRPDYLPPLTNPLDAKNSPLALLAQTCSAIGSDAPNPKLVATADKSTKSTKHPMDSNQEKTSPSSISSLSNSSSYDLSQPKSSFKPYESALQTRHDVASPQTDDRPSSANFRTITPKMSTTPTQIQLQSQSQANGRCESNQSSASQRTSSPLTAANNNNNNNKSNNNNNNNTNSHSTYAHGVNDLTRSPSSSSIPEIASTSPKRASSKESPASGVSSETTNSIAAYNMYKLSADALRESARIPLTPSSSSSTTTSATPLSSSSSSSSSSPFSSSGCYSTAPSVTTSIGAPLTSSASQYFNGYTSSGIPYSMDLMQASALMSPHQQSMYKAAAAAAMSPYYSYPRLKMHNNPSASDQMLSVCRDPYCTGCTLSQQMFGKAAAAAAAAAAANTGQAPPCPAGCAQCDHTSAAAAAAAIAKSYTNPSISAAQNSAAAAAYAHAQLVAIAAAQQLPYLCNWIGSDAIYCGKRFSTSDELLQHLRTHTASSGVMPESLMSSPVPGLPPNHPLFQRNYPTPPISPLSAARYHPYGKPSMLPSSLAPPPPTLVPSLAAMHNPALAPYMSPYSLYGPRLGQQHP